MNVTVTYSYYLYRLSAPSGAFIELPDRVQARGPTDAAETYFRGHPDVPAVIVRAAYRAAGATAILRVFTNESQPAAVNPFA